MQLHNVLISLIFAIGVVRCQIDWEHLTAQQLGQIAPDAFTTITVDQFTSIPIPAFRGWTTEQVRNIPADVFHHILPMQLSNFGTEACKGFTVDQMNLPADLCNNFNEHGCFGNIPPASFAGFSSHCLSVLSEEYAIEEMTAAQFSSIRLDSLIGLQVCDYYINLRAEIFPVITPAQLQSLSGRGCCMIDSRMYLMKDETLQAMDAHCMENLGDYAFRNITLRQFNLFSLDAIHAIGSGNFVFGNKTLWKELSVEQLTNLGSAAWSVFANQNDIFPSLIYKHGKSVVDLLTADQLYHIDTDIVSDLKEEIYDHFFKEGINSMYSWDDVKHELHVANWLKILLIYEGENNFAHHFTREVLAEMQGLSTMGIRGIIFGQIDPTAFSAFTTVGIEDLTRDQIANMTADQWNNLTVAQMVPVDFYYKVRRIPVSVVPHILPSHMAAMENTFGWGRWSCEQIYAITAAQLAALSKEWLSRFKIDLADCKKSEPQRPLPNHPPKAAPVPTPITDSPSSQSNHPQSSPSSATLSPSTSTRSRSIGTSGVFAIVLGCVAGLEAGVIGYYFYRKRRVNAVKYRALQESDSI